MSDRLAEMREWLARVWPEAGAELAPASSDASFRRYFRVRAGGISRIAMDAPPERESVQRYVQVARKLAQAGVHVPDVYAVDEARGFLLLGDFGERTYLDALASADAADALYRDAIAALLRLQTRADPSGLPGYDRALLERELGIFREWFLGRHLGVALDAASDAALASVEKLLVESALAQGTTFVHRDYHSRNLMVCERNPGVLDFQDAVVGPIAYDLVSLLRDCYVGWPSEHVARWLRAYHAQAASAGLPVGSLAELTRAFDLSGVQRHLKALGIFARLWHRDGKGAYLGDMPRVLGHVLEVAAQHRELEPLRALVERDVLPNMPQAGSRR
jgi:N-acetylmuramate 1-kinase